MDYSRPVSQFKDFSVHTQNRQKPERDWKHRTRQANNLTELEG